MYIHRDTVGQWLRTSLPADPRHRLGQGSSRAGRRTGNGQTCAWVCYPCALPDPGRWSDHRPTALWPAVAARPQDSCPCPVLVIWLSVCLLVCTPSPAKMTGKRNKKLVFFITTTSRSRVQIAGGDLRHADGWWRQYHLFRTLTFFTPKILIVRNVRILLYYNIGTIYTRILHIIIWNRIKWYTRRKQSLFYRLLRTVVEQKFKKRKHSNREYFYFHASQKKILPAKMQVLPQQCLDMQ